MVNWMSLVIPFAYLGVLLGSLATFSSLYRNRKSGTSKSPSKLLSDRFHLNLSNVQIANSFKAKASTLTPWFPPHLQRNIYLSLLHLEPESGSEKSVAVPESVLKAALLRRATEDIRRIMQIRSAKQALSSLLQRGSVGDDLWQRFLRAEKEMEEELRDVVSEVCHPLSGHRDVNMAAYIKLGKRLLTQLGPDNIPKRKRNAIKRPIAKTNRGDPVSDSIREGVVGTKTRYNPVRLYERARRRCRCRSEAEGRDSWGERGQR